MAGARGCSAAWATQVARLAVAGAGVCRRCDAVGAVKTAEVAKAKGCSAVEYCTGAGTTADYFTGAEECVVGSTAPVRRGSGATGARPTEVYCKGAGAAAEYCMGAEECVEGSTAPVRRGGAELQGRGPRKCTVREQGPQQSTVRERRSVWWGPQHPSVGGGGATGARPAESDRG